VGVETEEVLAEYGGVSKGKRKKKGQNGLEWAGGKGERQEKSKGNAFTTGGASKRGRRREKRSQTLHKIKKGTRVIFEREEKLSSEKFKGAILPESGKRKKQQGKGKSLREHGKRDKWRKRTNSWNGSSERSRIFRK